MMSGLPRPARMTPSPIDHLYRQLAAYGENCLDYQWNEVAILLAGAGRPGQSVRRRTLCAGKLQRHAGVESGNAVPAARRRWPDGGPEPRSQPPDLDGRGSHRGGRALGPAIHHVHGKDVRLERGVVEVNGLLETKPIDDAARRAGTMSPSAAAGICSGGRSSSRWCA